MRNREEVQEDGTMKYLVGMTALNGEYYYQEVPRSIWIYIGTIEGVFEKHIHNGDQILTKLKIDSKIE